MTAETAQPPGPTAALDDGERKTGPRVRKFDDNLSAADRAEAILDAIITAKGGSRREGQVQMAREVAEALSNQRPLLIQGGTGIGKALDIDTPIPTPRGFVRMGDLQAGDEVFNEDGIPVRVTDVFAYLEGRDCFRVTFSDGTSIVADGSHLWTTETISSMIAHSPWAGSATRTTEAIAQTLLNSAGRATHRIPVALPIQTAPADLAVHPYTLGAWLAGLNQQGSDAYALGQNLAVPDLEVETPQGRHVTAAKLSIHERRSRVRIALSTADALAVGEMLEDGVGIPQEYLFASTDQRRALMAGMLDVSGHVVGSNQVRFQDHRKTVADDFLTLAASLGYRPSLTKRQDCRAVWLVSFSTSDEVFATRHKNDRIVKTTRTASQRRTIISIEKVESRPVRCITVDSPRHLYLAGRTMVPTHNSIAYLAGALASGRQAVVAPHTKALQDQLRDDLELIRSAFPPGQKGVIPTPNYAIIKGRSSYLCLSKVKGDNDTAPPPPEPLLDEDGSVPSNGPTTKLGREVKKLYTWADETSTGERSDLPWPVSAKAWEQVSTTSNDCLGKACAFYEDCFANIERKRAFASDIIVINQAFLAAWMKAPGILPESIGAVIVDEAHEFNSVVADAFGSNVTPGRIEHTVTRALGALARAEAKAKAEDGAKAVKDAAESLSKKLVFPNKWDRTNMDLPGQVHPEIETVRGKLGHLREQVSAYVPTPTEQDSAKKDNLLREMDSLSRDLAMIIEGRNDQQVVWAERGFKDKIGLRAARFDVSDTIFQNLLYKIRSVAFTSATLTIAGDFALTARNFGFDQGPWAGRVVESPFDYETQGLIWMPQDMPEPGNAKEKSAAYLTKVAEVAAQTALAAGGRTLVLCTSNASVRAVSEHLSRVLPKRKHKVLAQGIGDLSAKELAKQFTDDPCSVLVGTRTFWTGISIEGDTCAAVVIDKVPFPVPTEPIIKARSDKADRDQGRGAGFKTVSLAEACLTMVQGAGRLVRTVSDRGVIVLCDPRLHPGGAHMKFYGPGMLRSLPPFPITSDSEQALQMLRKINETADDSRSSLEIDEPEST